MNKTVSESIKLFSDVLKIKMAVKVNQAIYNLKHFFLTKGILKNVNYGNKVLKILGTVYAAIRIFGMFLFEEGFALFSMILLSLIFIGVDGRFAYQLPFVFVMTCIVECLLGGAMSGDYGGKEDETFYAFSFLRIDLKRYILTRLFITTGIRALLTLAVFMITVPILQVPFWMPFLMALARAGYIIIGNFLNIKIGRKWLIILFSFIGLPVFIASFIFVFVGRVIEDSNPVFSDPATYWAADFVLLFFGIAAGFAAAVKLMKKESYIAFFKEAIEHTEAFRQANKKGSCGNGERMKALGKKKLAEDKVTDAKAYGTGKAVNISVFNDLFFRRHRKITGAHVYGLSVAAAVMTVLYLVIDATGNNFMRLSGFAPLNILNILYVLPIAVWLMTDCGWLTELMFVNCDKDMFSFNFYRNKDLIFKLFKKRLGSVLRLNAVVCAAIAIFMIVMNATVGSRQAPVDYLMIIVSLAAYGLFSSMLPLSLYYLLQPYTDGMKTKGIMYRLISFTLYPAMFIINIILLAVFRTGLAAGLIELVFMLIMSAILVYVIKFQAVKTFRLKSE